MSLIVVVGQFDVHPEDLEEVAGLMRAMMNETVKELGCHHYSFSTDLVTAGRFQLSELWEDDAALAAHMESGHMAAYRAGMTKARIQTRTVRRYHVTTMAEL